MVRAEERATAPTQPIPFVLGERELAHGKPATHLHFGQQASYLQVWVTVRLRMESRLPALLVEVVAVQRWLDLLGKRHSS